MKFGDVLIPSERVEGNPKDAHGLYKSGSGQLDRGVTTESFETQMNNGVGEIPVLLGFGVSGSQMSDGCISITATMTSFSIFPKNEFVLLK